MRIKPNIEYFISVEGETEIWYFDHLIRLINKSEEAELKVKCKPRKDKSPVSNMKRINRPGKSITFHICDYESNDPDHVRQFREVLDELHSIRNAKSISYELGYSNFTFDLFIILHKKNCPTAVGHRRNYLSHINQAFGTTYQSMNDYKHEDNFKSILSTITLDDVKKAIERAKLIRKRHIDEGDAYTEYKKFTYYQNEPDLSINDCVEKMLNDCGL